MNLSNLIVSYIRTWAVIAVGAVLGWLVAKGMNLGDSIQQPLTEVTIALTTAAWYFVVRLLEHLPDPWGKLFGYLLGVPTPPSYPPAKK